ncbi:PfkB family carbohydrate kinase [Amycolatopsis granulosa]|uniref:PfkB family carbohydrate kinase n=1 Tax=Amycolatopsis granulosa TaxID=185684 RepID=UPI00312CA2C6|nr:sugar/nucleoside kinase (ribokinase family) [Amycolatopsis granulosa]
MRPEVVVAGPSARDLVLRVGDVTRAGAPASRAETRGGTGANQAAGIAQPGVPVTSLSVTGDDHAGHDLPAHAAAGGRPRPDPGILEPRKQP